MNMIPQGITINFWNCRTTFDGLRSKIWQSYFNFWKAPYVWTMLWAFSYWNRQLYHCYYKIRIIKLLVQWPSHSYGSQPCKKSTWAHFVHLKANFTIISLERSQFKPTELEEELIGQLKNAVTERVQRL